MAVRSTSAAVVSGHGAATRGPRLQHAFAMLRDLAGRDAAVEPGQADLEAMLGAHQPAA
jgi:hypothetical protein